MEIPKVLQMGDYLAVMMVHCLDMKLVATWAGWKVDCLDVNLEAN